MKSDVYSNFNVNFQSSWYDKFFKRIPNKSIEKSEQFNKLGAKLASPHWNRATLGLAAISTQPAWDYFNPKVDKDTAKASAIRTTSKIAVCSTVGFTIRGLCYKLTEKFAHATPSEGSTLLTPKSILNESNIKIRNNKLKLHKNAFSTVTALTVMLFTNFLVDAPLTTYVSNKVLKLANLDKKNEGKNEEIV